MVIARPPAQRLLGGAQIRPAEQCPTVEQQRRAAGLETAYCAETVAITYEEMGLLSTEKRENYFDPGKFWSGDHLSLAPGYALGEEIAVRVDPARV